VQDGAPVDDFDAVFAIVPALAGADEAISRAPDLLASAAEQAGSWLAERLGGR
jgi:hypothetical protein